MEYIYENVVRSHGGLAAKGLFFSGVFFYFAAAVPEATNIMMAISIFLTYFVATRIYLSFSENTAWVAIVPLAICLPLVVMIFAIAFGSIINNPIVDDPKAWLRIWILLSIVSYIFLFYGFAVAIMTESILKSKYGKQLAWKIRTREMALIPSHCVVTGMLSVFLIQTVI